MSSEIRVNKINNRAGLGTVEYTPTGIIVSGIVTAYEFDGNFDTTPGIVVTGIATAAGIDLNGDLDVDGHTNLDNLSVAGVSTFSSNITLNGGLVASSTVNAGQILVGTGVTIEANQVATGQATFTGIVTASHFYGNGANLTALNASNISSGTVPSARLGSGTASSSTFLAGDSTFKTVTGTTINNNADNRLITGSGSANTLNAESNLTFDGTTLQVENSGSGLRNLLRLKNSNASAGVSGLYFNSTTSGTAFDAACVRNGVNGSGQGRLYLQTNNGSGLVTNLNIEYDGQVSIPTNSLNIIDSIVHIGDTDTKIRFPSDNQISFETGGAERFRINNIGHVTVNATSYQALTITTSENGTNGPEIQLMHNSASPAANDTIGQLRYSGKDSAGDTTLFSKIETKATTVTNGSETGHIDFSTRGGGAYNSMFRLSARGTASAPSYTTDDMNGIILDTYNTGNPYPRYMNFIAKSAGNTDSNIGFWTEAVGGSPTQKMTIDASGTITTPLHPIFATRINYVNSYVSSGTKIQMKAAHIDTRSSFSDANDRYVAPAAGRYLFYFFSNIDYNGDGTIAVIFRKNGSDFTSSEGGHIYSYAQNSGWHLLSGQIITTMAVNDYMEVFTSANNMKVDGNSYGQFGGYMIG